MCSYKEVPGYIRSGAPPWRQKQNIFGMEWKRQNLQRFVKACVVGKLETYFVKFYLAVNYLFSLKRSLMLTTYLQCPFACEEMLSIKVK